MKYLLERSDMDALMGDGFRIQLGAETFILVAEAAIRRLARRARRLEDGAEAPGVTGEELPNDENKCGKCGKVLKSPGGLAKHKTDMKHWEPELEAEAEKKTQASQRYRQNALDKEQHRGTRSKQKDITRDAQGNYVHTLCGFKTKKSQAIAGHIGPCRARHGQPYRGHQGQQPNNSKAV